MSNHAARSAKCLETRVRLMAGFAKLPLELNGDPERLLPHVVNVSFTGVDSEALMVALKEHVAISNGSACTSSSYKPSHVLAAMGFAESRVRTATRWSWCHLSGEPDFDDIRKIIAGIQKRD